MKRQPIENDNMKCTLIFLVMESKRTIKLNKQQSQVQNDFEFSENLGKALFFESR